MNQNLDNQIAALEARIAELKFKRAAKIKRAEIIAGITSAAKASRAEKINRQIAEETAGLYTDQALAALGLTI